ncbi:urease accessory protein UreF [Phormidium sp. CLA17]|uniref:urease accessory protein UreF n=1 Tax=Leptolyngbya sp. Cla-17 TaxID=2803751 RepID=UPI0014910FC8|nr:urease accessory protein UreF [Leptolyngbya sp. Cla-17]MBM0741786.1 urease accessory protein UreF [Leptolyngbya sp. Cla-17]
MNSDSLLHLLQLASPALPVGAYSYSEGLEALVELGKVTSQETLAQWLSQELRWGAVRLEAAVMMRSCERARSQDFDAVIKWNCWLTAARETEELRQQSLQMGRSLLKLLLDLHPELINGYEPLQKEGCNFAIAYAIAAAYYQIDIQAALLAYLYSWIANLVSAGVKLIPLGQTAGQRLLLTMQPALERAAEAIFMLQTDDLCSCSWGLSLASMAHERQYSRLFRS